MKLHELVRTSERVAGSGGRLEKVAALAELLRRLDRREASTAVALLAGRLPQGRIGVGWATLERSLAEDGSREPQLELAEVAATFERVVEASGTGSVQRKVQLLADLLGRATAEEQRFLTRLLLGELRQGALEGVMVEALARAAEIPAAEIRRAAMLSGDLLGVAVDVLTHGATGLAGYRVELFRPLQPMLAQPAASFEEAFERYPRLGLEYKVDGARIQVHRQGERVRVFSRRLKEVTASVPEVVEAALALPAEEVILDGEAVALRPDGRPQPFQTTMRRFGRKLDTDRLRRELPLGALFFDCLYLDGESAVELQAAERWRRLEETVPEAERIPRVLASAPGEAKEFLERALASGHEGIMAKEPEAAYEAGSRGQSWLKIKPTFTLDLVVLAAEWGHGRRRGKLSNLHLGARKDGTTDQFVMLGKTFKGLTDRMLGWQTERFLELEAGRDGHTVYVRPEQVVEVAFNDVQESPQYPGGLALRFARVKGYRQDKAAAEADTLAAVQAIWHRIHGS